MEIRGASHARMFLLTVTLELESKREFVLCVDPICHTNEAQSAFFLEKTCFSGITWFAPCAPAGSGQMWHRRYKIQNAGMMVDLGRCNVHGFAPYNATCGKLGEVRVTGFWEKRAAARLESQRRSCRCDPAERGSAHRTSVGPLVT